MFEKIQYKDNYMVGVSGYVIKVEKQHYSELMDRIGSHKDIKPEAIGFLLGKAVPELEKLKCKFCDKFIKKGTEHKVELATLRGNIIAHENCVKEYNKQRKAGELIADSPLDVFKGSA